MRWAAYLAYAACLMFTPACGGGGSGGGISDVSGDADGAPDAPDAPDDPDAQGDWVYITDCPMLLDQDTGEAPFELRGSCALEERFGAFLVEVQEDFSFVDGSIADGVIPITILEEVQSLGTCKLLKRNNPFCTPPCAPGETCDHDGSCIPFPEPQDLGTVTVTGLAAEAILDPLQPGNSYFLTTLPHPAFQGGKAIELTSTDGFFGPLELYGVGVDDLTLGEVDWEIAEGADLALTWPAPSTAGVPAHVNVIVNIDQHGNSPVILTCDFPDTGTAAVPAELIDALLSSGVSGYPNGRIARRTVDSMAVGAGCMELVVSSPRTPDVRVIGHTPCKSDGDCPDGEACNVAMETCG
jgi:hypothetical protein